jgi:hypothetical protein
MYRFIYVRGLSAPHYEERNSHLDHPGTMHDSFALARLILALIVRPFVFATSTFIGVSATYVIYILMRRRISAYRSQLRDVPGPGGAHWFKGNFTKVQETDSTCLQEEWVRKYGHVLKFQSLLWVRFLFSHPLEMPNTIVWRSVATETTGRGPRRDLLRFAK